VSVDFIEKELIQTEIIPPVQDTTTRFFFWNTSLDGQDDPISLCGSEDVDFL
jgi:hypothetical protein